MTKPEKLSVRKKIVNLLINIMILLVSLSVVVIIAELTLPLMKSRNIEEAVNTANVVMENNTGNTLIPFTALLNATNVVGLTAVSLGTGLTTGTTTAFIIGTNTIVLSNATMPFSVNNVQDDVTSGSLAFTTSAQPALTVTITLPTITGPIIADGIRISIA